ncbi:TonB-dependent receptor [Brevundimonas nasdae]|uniref:TonB-dependent receptor n=1 Tax=Brevundimonas nasdae TaxID=172043 RepID=A0ABX8TJP6_9CAUL|nr:TonB-dependent receptor [Brevundimonas nasdae]QYC11446.1 TonB-dependent receptor [Brevundimonas nasdae]QYC14234.1 TonB-dependent receptor [Brevundimonas nasdae]
MRAYDIPTGGLADGLAAFTAASGAKILYGAEVTTGRRTQGLRGRYTVDNGLVELLRGTGLSVRRARPDVWVVVDPHQTRTSAEAPTLEEVVVTGSLIRGAGDGPSPVTVIRRDDMERAGHGTVAQALAALPQNFGGTGNEGALGNGGDRSGSNGNFASGVNLRGLGSDATLVLINGRRMGGSGAFGDFADISTIPTIAISRIDVLLDGASALYGSDAIGGVVNVILRRDYEGAETRVRVGRTWDGPSGEHQFGQSLGARWTSGSILAAYEYNDREALPASDRRLAGDADLRWRGGSDRRLYYAAPGNIVLLDPAVGYLPAYAIPGGQDGTALQPSDFIAGAVNYGNQRAGLNVLPRQTRHSGFLALNQALGDRLHSNADARFGRRDYETISAPLITVLNVTRANPYFVSPVGASAHTIAYSFANELPNPVTNGHVESLGLSLGLDGDLFSDWRLSTYVAYASETGDNLATGQLNSLFLREALGATPDNPATTYSAARDGYLNPFAGIPVNDPATLAFISQGWARSEFETTTTTYNLQVDGSLFDLPAGPLRLALGGGYRQETFWRRISNFSSAATPTIGAPADFDRDVAFGFAELRAPLFGPDNARPGLRRLELSAALRFEDYGDIGSTTNPKLGLIWAPAQDWIVRANYGSSFRAPNLRELHDPARQSPTFIASGGQATTLSMILYGGNPDLKPEEADTWTAGAEYRPAELEGLTLTANWFRTTFDSRIGQPTSENTALALSDPSYTAFVRRVDPANNAADRDAVQEILDRPSTSLGSQYPATAYGAIVDARWVNTSQVDVEGLDLGVRHAVAYGSDRLETTLNLTYLTRYDVQTTPTSPVVSRLDQPAYPLSLRGRGGLTWSRDAWSASGHLNYVGDYADLTGRRIGAWLTADAHLRYAPTNGPLAGATVSLTVQNLTDQDPPFYDAIEGVGYDAANADVRGRFIAVQLKRAW